jgi:hypothetical protein
VAHISETPPFLQKNKASDLLPQIGRGHHNRQINSVDLDPPFSDYNYEQSSLFSRLEARGNPKNRESEAMSRALGFVGANRYSNQEIYRENPSKIISASPRGPCPTYLLKAPSMPSILLEAEKKSQQYEQDLQRGLR